VQFDTHYVNAPVCCPSRASIWSGRQPHKINHTQVDNPALVVNGAWNNYEGNSPDYNDLLGDVMHCAL
jgi:arylsulfatase A-like enzyme